LTGRQLFNMRCACRFPDSFG